MLPKTHFLVRAGNRERFFLYRLKSFFYYYLIIGCRMKLKLLFVLAALALIACGEDTETLRVTDRYTLDMLGKGVSLTEEKCDSARTGQLLYVSDSTGIFYCTGKVWKKVNGEDGKDGRDGKDAKDGTDGKKGENGASGTDCFVEEFADGVVLGCGATKAIVRYNFEIPDTCSIKLNDDSSYVLICGKDTASLVQGLQGDAGDICKQVDIGGGQVRLICGQDSVTLFRAVCGETPFNPDSSQFCYGDTLVDRCGTRVYDIKKQFCYGDSLVDLCGGKKYDCQNEKCYDGLVGLKCPTAFHANEFCDERNGKVYKFEVIGNAVWMADHLDYRVPNSFCASPDKEDDLYCGPSTGRLYPWTVAMVKDHSECGEGHSCSGLTYPHQGVCPDGWHIPERAEWEKMMEATGSKYARDYWDESVPLLNWGSAQYGRNISGFSALPVGIIAIVWNEQTGLYERDIRNGPGSDSIGHTNSADFWMSTETSEEKVNSCFIFTDANTNIEFRIIEYPKDVFARIIRCVKDWL